MIYICHTESPVGRITLTSDGEAIVGLTFEEERHPQDRSGAVEERVAVLVDAERQVQEYLGGRRNTFDLPLQPKGTEFQRRVWSKLLEIPFGKTTSYLELARGIGNEKAVRAVGLANGRNPISVIIPCHRVIGSNGNLVGYGGGLARKEFLLHLEGVRSKSSQRGLFPES